MYIIEQTSTRIKKPRFQALNPGLNLRLPNIWRIMHSLKTIDFVEYVRQVRLWTCDLPNIRTASLKLSNINKTKSHNGTKRFPMPVRFTHKPFTRRVKAHAALSTRNWHWQSPFGIGCEQVVRPFIATFPLFRRKCLTNRRRSVPNAGKWYFFIKIPTKTRPETYTLRLCRTYTRTCPKLTPFETCLTAHSFVSYLYHYTDTHRSYSFRLVFKTYYLFESLFVCLCLPWWCVCASVCACVVCRFGRKAYRSRRPLPFCGWCLCTRNFKQRSNVVPYMNACFETSKCWPRSVFVDFNWRYLY